MNTKLLRRSRTLSLTVLLLVLGSGMRAAPAPDPNIGVNGYYSNDKAQRGRTVQAAIVMEIPPGYHVNSNRPLNKYSIPTALKIEGPRGVTIAPVIYPHAIVRKMKALNNEPCEDYECRTIML